MTNSVSTAVGALFWMPQTGPSSLDLRSIDLGHKFHKAFPAMLKIPELVERRTGRRQENHVSTARKDLSPPHSASQRPAHRDRRGAFQILPYLRSGLPDGQDF